jgi:hypothetical protein
MAQLQNKLYTCKKHGIQQFSCAVLVLAVSFGGKVSQEMYSSVHSSTMVGKLVFKVHYF